MANNDPRTWSTHYWRNPAVALRFEQIEAPYREQMYQVLMDTILQTVFLAADGYTIETKHRSEGTEPDNKVLRTVEYNAGNAFHDVLVIEIKRPPENLIEEHFRGYKWLLEDHMGESSNPNNTQLFGEIQIGAYVKFYVQRMGQPAVNPIGMQGNERAGMLHLWDDRLIVQRYFEHFKQRGGRV